MQKNSKIYIAGHTGLVGNALKRNLEKQGYDNLIFKTHQELDLTRQSDVETFFEEERPEYVFLTAALVGGIHANSIYPANFIYENTSIQSNLIHSSYLFKVKKLMFFGSSCMYPKLCEQPMKIESILTGSLEETNIAYAMAKLNGYQMCQAYRKQYGCNFITVIPAGLYGINDNFHPDNGHVIPALIRRFHEAKIDKLKSVTLWGTGSAKREFLYIDDLVDAAVFLMQKYDSDLPINIGSNIVVSIKELAEIVLKTVEFPGSIELDPSKPDGMPIKMLESSPLEKLGWTAHTPLKEGIEKSYKWFLENIV